MAKKTRRNPKNIADYIVATEVEGKTKAEAYAEHVDSDVKNPRMSAMTLEKTDEYVTMRTEIIENANQEAVEYASKSTATFNKAMHKGFAKLEKMIDAAESPDEIKSALSELRHMLDSRGDYLSKTVGAIQPRPDGFDRQFNLKDSGIIRQ